MFGVIVLPIGVGGPEGHGDATLELIGLGLVLEEVLLLVVLVSLHGVVAAPRVRLVGVGGGDAAVVLMMPAAQDRVGAAGAVRGRVRGRVRIVLTKQRLRGNVINGQNVFLRCCRSCFSFCRRRRFCRCGRSPSGSTGWTCSGVGS